MRSLRGFLLAFVAVASLASVAAAQQGQPGFSYAAPWECPNREHFWRQLRARSTRLARTALSESGVSLDARISGAGARYVGHLRLVEPEGTVVEREVAGPTCVDVSAALALIAAVTLDGTHAQARTGLPVPAIQKEKPRPIAVGLVAGIYKAIAPEVVPTLGVSATYHDRTRFGSPELRIEALIARRPWQPVTGASGPVGDASFLWVASRLEACPFQAELAPITVGPCALFELGALQGKGRTPSGAGSGTGWWVAPGALLNWSVQADRVMLRLAVGAVRPLIRDYFRFSPAPDVFRPPSLGGMAEFELAWAF